MNRLIRITAAASLLALFQSGSLAGETYVQTVKVPDGATLEEIVELSTKVVPHPRQMDWHKDEFIAFIHWGPNAWNRREWGSGNESPDIFNPTNFDSDQWCEAMKAAGIKRVILTVKHHEGFCLWPSRYTDHSVASSNWMDGKGDVLGSLSKSCEKYGLKLGVYLSPADLYEIKDGNRYGNQSKYRKETIPTPVKGRPFKDKHTFEFEVDDYNLYFMNQLFELLTEYGPIHEVWFDGAHPKRKGGQTYVRPQWTELIHTLAPNAMIAVKGADTRWCGNEAGHTRISEFNVLPLGVEKYEDEQWNDRCAADLASRGRLKGSKWLHYYPAEINTSIRHGWFYRDDEHQKVRTADDVFDIYERAVGGNATFLLNIPPNREGTFSPRDVAALEETGRRIAAVYGTSLNEGASGPREALDGNEATCWLADGLVDEFEITLPEPRRVNRCVLQEAIASKGQRVEKHALDVWVDGKWEEVATATTIGYKRILRFAGVTTDRFRVRFLESRAPATIANVTFHFYDAPPNPVEIRPGSDGRVTLVSGIPGFWKSSFNANNSQPIYYTIDGSAAIRYTEPFLLPEGGLVKAWGVVGNRKGAVASRAVGYPSREWNVVSVSGEQNAKHTPAKNAIDRNAKSGWMSKAGEGEKYFAVDMGERKAIGGFTYLPHPKKGLVENYRFEVSDDGKAWSVATEGTFGNIVNDPSVRTVRLAKPVNTRYVRFVCVSAANNQPQMSIQEIEIVSPGASM